VAYDAELADRVRGVLSIRDRVSEREMFGGIGFMVGGNMACGVRGEELVVRLDPDEGERALAEAHTREFDITGRPMRGWLMVAPAALGDDEALAGWVDAGADFAASLPAK
jgi:hypothetical protein